MILYGKATIFGSAGTVTVPALAMVSDSLEREHTADVEEHTDGNGELLGFCKRNERYNADIVLVPSAASQDAANATLAPLTIPCKVTLAGFPTKSGSDTVLLNGDYIYKGGAKDAIIKGQATKRIPLFRPLSAGGSLTIDQLVAAVT